MHKMTLIAHYLLLVFRRRKKRLWTYCLYKIQPMVCLGSRRVEFISHNFVCFPISYHWLVDLKFKSYLCSERHHSTKNRYGYLEFLNIRFKFQYNSWIPDADMMVFFLSIVLFYRLSLKSFKKISGALLHTYRCKYMEIENKNSYHITEVINCVSAILLKLY